ncbi:MAG: hypothetical protein QXL82_02105 [Candidatus Aenigmatarchaeota archaeon]
MDRENENSKDDIIIILVNPLYMSKYLTSEDLEEMILVKFLGITSKKFLERKCVSRN